MSRYDVTSVLAEGGQGRVYRATDRITGQACVLKTGETVREEALLALQLSHPYVARPFDAGIDSKFGQYAAYPEYTETPLLQWSRESNPAELQRVALQIAEFLAFLHRRGWLYHDFKPEHFLVARQSIRVLDLGLAQPIQESSQTFSGTFPYIAPERLAGRKCDARSDIFALGMLLLHVLQPDETWDFEPSVEVLQNLQKRTRKLTGFWKDLLSEMISLEPAQRIESAAELWKRLLPSNARGSFLFFPIPAYFSIPETVLAKQIVTIQTASNLNVSEAEKITLQESWKKGIFTASFDLRHKTPEDVFRTICWAQINEQPADLFSAIESLQKASDLQPYTVVLRNAEALNPTQRPLLAYALSALQNVPALKFVLVGGKQAIEVPEESSAKVEIPLLTKQTLNDLLPQAFPTEGFKQDRLEKAKARGYSLPDQLLADLRKQLPQDALLLWPAAARDLAPAAALERLRATEMRILGALAIASSPLPKEWLFAALRLTESAGMEWIESLQARGYLQLQNDCVTIVINPHAVLERLRKDRTRQIAAALLSNSPLTAEPEILYRYAKASRNKSNATLQALRVATKFPERSDAAQEWYWKAFLAGAELPKKNLYRLAKFSQRTARHRRTRAIFGSITKRFGHSFRLANEWLNLYLRIGDFVSAEKFARRIAQLARKRDNDSKAAYFLARQSGFLIRLNKHDEAENILQSLQRNPFYETKPKLKGLIEHYIGLASFHKGRFEESVQSFQRAVKFKHPEISSSYMNLGIVFGRLGQLEKAEKWLTKAVSIFKKENDSERLSFALGNLGIAYKQQGKTQLARDCYFRSLQLSRIYQNVLSSTTALINLSASYEVEGRLTKALVYSKRAIKLGRQAKLPRQVAYALTHAGRIYGIVGKYKESIVYLKKPYKYGRNYSMPRK